MTRCESRWVNVVIIALVVILRSPTLLPSMYLIYEAYYGTIANDILDGGTVYHTAVDTKPPGMYYIYAGVFQLAGRNNLRAVHLLALFVHAYLPRDTLGANSEIFASLPLVLSVLVFLQGEEKAGWGWMFLSGAL